MTHLEKALNRRLRQKGVLIKPSSYIPEDYKLTDDGRDEFVHQVMQDVKDAEVEEARARMKRT